MNENVHTTEEPSKKSFSQKDFLTDYAERIKGYREHARHNYFAACTCYAVAIGASLLGTIVAATDILPKAALAVLTAIPGTALLVNSVFSLEKKSAWFFKKARRYDGTLMRLRFEGLDLASASKDLRTFDEEMEGEYPKFGMMPQTMQHKKQPSQ